MLKFGSAKPYPNWSFNTVFFLFLLPELSHGKNLNPVARLGNGSGKFGNSGQEIYLAHEMGKQSVI